MVVQNAALDSISAFSAPDVNGKVTATVSFTGVYAPTYVYGPNTYVIGQKIYISGADDTVNNGLFTVTGVTGAGTASGTIVFTNASGVARSNQYALCSATQTILKDLTTPVNITAATPFSYDFVASGQWNPPPTYGTGGISTYTYSTTNGSNPRGTVTGKTTLTIPFAPVSSSTITKIQLEFQPQKLENIYPYKFNPTITLPLITGLQEPDGTSYLTFDAANPTAKCLIYGSYTLGNPSAIAIVGSNYYIADQTNYVIRKVSGGIPTIFAGQSGTPGTTNGIGFLARFTSPADIVYVNPYLYVADGTNIRRIEVSTATVSTITAGGYLTGACGLTWNLGTKLYVTSSSNGKVCSIDLTASVPIIPDTVTTLINNPTRIAYDPTGNLYVTDPTANKVYKIVIATQVVTVIAGTGTTGSLDGWALSATFNQPWGIAYDASHKTLFVCDKAGHTLRSIDLNTNWVMTIAGSGTSGSTDGTGTAASFVSPTGILLTTPTTMTISETTGLLRNVAVVYPGVATLLASPTQPYGLAISGNNLYTICGDDTVREISLPGGSITTVSSDSSLFGYGLAIDSTGTYIYVASQYGLINRVAIASGEVTTVAGVAGSTTENDTDTYFFGEWAHQPSPYDATLWTACATGGIRTFVGGIDGRIFGSVSKSTWFPSYGPEASFRSPAGYTSIACSADGSIVIAAPDLTNPTSNGCYSILVSTNSGYSFSTADISGMDSSAISPSVAVSADGSTFYVSDVQSHVLWFSTDLGGTWTADARFNASAGGYLAYAFVDETNIIAMVDNNRDYIPDGFFTAVIRGTPFDYANDPSVILLSSIESPTTAIAMAPTGSVIITRNDGRLYISNTIFTSFIEQTDLTDLNLTFTSLAATSSYFIATTPTSVYVSDSINQFGSVWTERLTALTNLSRVSSTADGLNCIILSSTVQTVWYYTGIYVATFNRPQWIAISSDNLYLYVIDAPACTLRKVEISTGVVTTVASGLTYPQGIVLGPTTTAFVADYNRILQINLTNGSIVATVGDTQSGFVDGDAATARFNFVVGLAYDSTNDLLYVTDQTNRSIRRIDFNNGGYVTTLTAVPLLNDLLYGLALNSTCTTLYVTSDVGRVYSINIAPIATVSTQTATIPTGANAISIGGVTRSYTTAKTITCTPLSDGLSYSLSFDGGPGLATFTTSSGLIQASLMYSNVLQTTAMNVVYSSPIPISSYTASETPYIEYTTGTSQELVPFISPTDTTVTISADNGFPYIPNPPTLSYNLQLFSFAVPNLIFDRTSNTITVNSFPLNVTPALTSPLTLYMYQPFSYTFSLPNYVVNTVLDAVDYSSTALAPYLSLSADKTVLTFSSSGATVPSSLAGLNVNALYGTSTATLASNSNTVSILPSYLVVTPYVPSGVPINLYKYEPFDYTFAVVGVNTTLTLRYSRSSPQLTPYITLTNNASVISFYGTPPASYSSTFTLAIDLMNGTSVVTSLDYPVTISAGRVKLLPSSPYTLYQYERISNTLGSNISWSAANSPDSIISVPTLPYGLSFSNSYIVGIPQTQQPQRNYQLIASNSTNGSISTSTVSFTVGVPIVRITPSAVDFTGLGIQSTPTTTFTVLVPVNPYRKTFRYLWSPDLPSGLVFSKTNGQEFVSSDETMPDDVRTISLSGTPDMTDASGFPSSGIVSIILSGIYKDSTNVQTIGTSKLTLQFAETVLMTASASSNIYVGKALGSNDVVVTAASYFPSTSGISNFTASGLPAGSALASNSVIFPTRWWLTGTPTVASSSTYTFTATNSNAITKSASIGIQTKLDVVRFSLTPSNVNFIVSKPLDGLFQVKATADSGSAVTYSTTFNLATYGLSLNSTTGILTGTPTSTLSNNIVFTATSALGVSSNYVSSNFQIVADTFTWPTPTFSFFQNRAITPYQLSVTTVSGRTIQSFSSTNMPAGLILNPSGLISGTPTGTTGGTFTVTASTGYQAPPTASQSYTYTVVPDNLLVIQQNGVDSFSNSVFTVPFTTIQYSTGNFISPVYSFTTYPPQYPAPVFTLSQSGVLSGNFTGVPAPYALYNAGITATYGSISNTTNVVISIGDAPKPLLLVGYWIGNTGEYTVKTTSSYVFSASVAGTPVISNQTWSTSLTAGNPITGQRPGYPDLAMSGTGFVAVTPSNVYDGIYNSTTGSVTWSNNTPTLSGAFGCVASDGNSNWIIVEKTGTALVSYERYGNTGSWTKKTDLNGRLTNQPSDTSSPVTIAYINGNYVYGQSTSGVYCNVLYKPVGADRWSVPTTLPALPIISKLATNNTTIVAIGYATAPLFNIISYSTTLTTWITPTQPTWLTSAGTYPIDIAYGGGMWVVIGGYALGGFIVYSPDLSNWTPYSPAIPIGFPDILEWDMQSVAFNGNAWTISASYTDVDRGGPARVILTLDAGQWPTQTISISTVNDFNTGGNYGNTSRILATAFSNTSSFSGTVTNAVGSISFRVPRETDFVLYQYVPYSISARAVGVSGFIYYYATGVPIGFQFVSDSVGYRATLSGISPSNGSAVVTLYAKTASSSLATLKINLRTVIPYFVNPQSGAAAYTAILRDQVDANAAQNARDKSTFPQVDSLAGPFMAPRAPDVITQSNCFLGLCKKPCPTCRTTL
jgi:sugar lactone lactonase YvrE